LQALAICLDISESMAYGEPAKLDQAISTIEAAVGDLSPEIPVGLVTFDVTAEVLLDLKRLDKDKIRDTLDQIVPRGVSCIAAGLAEAVSFIEKSGKKGEVLLLTDGRANLSRDRMGGFEGSLDLEMELLEIAKEGSQKGVAVHTVAVGEDAFTHTLSAISRNSRGNNWLAEDFQSLDEETVQAMEVLEKDKLRVHSAPAELPSAQPTWTKESQFTHVAVVSQHLSGTYEAHHRAFLVNPLNSREARTALISIESDVLAAYRQRRPKTAQAVRKGEALLLDKSYRDFLGSAKDDKVELAVY